MNKQDSREDYIQTAPLPDLELPTEQADETKGGAGPGSRDAHFRESTFGNELMN